MSTENESLSEYFTKMAVMLVDCKAAILTLEEADTTPGAKSGDQSTTTEERQTGSSSSKPTQQFQVTWFSKEHRLSAPKERARIRARGGWFRHGRVGGVLEPTRSERCRIKSRFSIGLIVLQQLGTLI